MPLEKPEDTAPVGLYIRTLAGDPGIFLQVQLMALQGYAKRNRLAVARVLFDIQGGRSQFEACWPRPPVRTRPSGRSWSTTRGGSGDVRMSWTNCGPGWRGTGSG